MTKEDKKIHDCFYFYGVMRDVTYRKSTKKFYCRRCGEALEDNQVEDKILKTERIGR